MTWNYQYEEGGTELHIWDHTQDPATDNPYQTQTNEEGWQIFYPYDMIISDVMEADIVAELENNDSPTMRMMWVVADKAFGRIERYQS